VKVSTDSGSAIIGAKNFFDDVRLVSGLGALSGQTKVQL
jgi:hypothetical protein